MKAVFLDYNTIGPNDLDPSPLMKYLPDLKLFDSTLPEEISSRIKNAEFILTNKVKLNADNLKDAKQLKFIGLTATGADNIDLKYAQENTIRVCNIRAYCTQSVVEHVFGVILNLTHNIHQYHKLVANGAWQQSDDFCVLQYPIKELSAMTLGIVGYGELGSSVAKMGSHFGMRVLITTRSTKSLNENEKSVSLQKLLKHSDVISLHCPLTDLTKNLIGEKILNISRRSKYLILHFKNKILLIHLGMTGKLLIMKSKNNQIFKTSFYYDLNILPEHSHIYIMLNNGLKLIYNDVRRFGFFKLYCDFIFE